MALTPEIDAAVDGDGNRRHPAVELSATRDEDPAGHVTLAVLGLSLAWQPLVGLQLDVGSNIGLNGNSADVEAYTGISRRF